VFGSPLELMLGEDAGGFITGVYERSPLIVRHGDPGRFADLLNIERVDRILAERDLQRGMVMLADASSDLREDDYVTPSGVIDRGAVTKAYARGATIILNQLHQSDATLADFCRALELMFSCHVQTNVYLTPPRNQGFRTHYDNHDVFVLQVTGEKTWRSYEQVDPPYRGERFSPHFLEGGEPAETFTLAAGDCAYLPRGLVHDAVASGDEPSLHITCGLIVRTWAELVLEAVSEVCINEPAFRRTLPPDFASRTFDRAAAAVSFDSLMSLVRERARADKAWDLMTDALIRTRELDLSGVIIGAFAPAPGAYAAASGMWRIAPEPDGRLRLIAPNGDMVFDAAARPAVERMLSGAAFEAECLVGADTEIFE
jgi:lysine-specific demethylase/histidyl-hydroxylase NO66